MVSVETQRLFSRGELNLGFAFARRDVFVLVFVFVLEFVIHVRQAGLGSLLKRSGESFAGAMKFAAHSIGGLLGEVADLIVAQLLIGH